MELQQLRYFKAVADAGKISEAAKSLYISSPALSATISRLEKELDTKLFTRTNNRILLNRQGEILLDYVNQVLRLLGRAEAELKQSAQGEKQHLQVAVTNSNLWVGLICAFSPEHPEITLSFTTLKLSQLSDPAVLSRYQFLLSERGEIPPSLAVESVTLIRDDRPVLAVHPQHPLAKKASVQIREIADETLVLPVFDQSLHRMTCQLLDAAGIAHNSAMECSYMVRRSMVMDNRGVSFSTLCSSKYEEQSCRYVPIVGVQASWEHCLSWPEDHKLTEAEKLFRDFAIAYFEAQK
ncbi:MAG: LysR family transcriptional regulator [Oscillospiraceae bacterium]|nr:LysR family transcriptional regulator [Oscillospiraceae bacterium]